MSELYPQSRPLQAAIFCQNNEILKLVLKYTPRLSGLLADAIGRYWVLLPQSSSGSETIKLLTEHFAPLSPDSRAWLITHSCAVGDVALLEEFAKSEPLFSHRIHAADGIFPTDIHFAFACGNVDSLRFLLDNGVAQGGKQCRFRTMMEMVLAFNQIDCYRELYPHIEKARELACFACMAVAENAEKAMSDFIAAHEDQSEIFEPLYIEDPPAATVAQVALWNAIQRLRPGNARFLLDLGVPALPWRKPQCIIPFEYENVFEISWAYFNLNRDAFVRTQEMLDEYGLPKLRIVV